MSGQRFDNYVDMDFKAERVTSGSLSSPLPNSDEESPSRTDSPTNTLMFEEAADRGISSSSEEEEAPVEESYPDPSAPPLYRYRILTAVTCHDLRPIDQFLIVEDTSKWWAMLQRTTEEQKLFDSIEVSGDMYDDIYALAYRYVCLLDKRAEMIPGIALAQSIHAPKIIVPFHRCALFRSDKFMYFPKSWAGINTPDIRKYVNLFMLVITETGKFNVIEFLDDYIFCLTSVDESLMNRIRGTVNGIVGTPTDEDGREIFHVYKSDDVTTSGEFALECMRYISLCNYNEMEDIVRANVGDETKIRVAKEIAYSAIPYES